MLGAQETCWVWSIAFTHEANKCLAQVGFPAIEEGLSHCCGMACTIQLGCSLTDAGHPVGACSWR